MSFICFLFVSARSCDACVSHQPSVTVEVTSEPWRACTAREAFDMIPENRELGGKKEDPCMSVAGRKKKSFCSNSADELLLCY